MLGGLDLSSPSSYIEKHTLTGTDDVLRFAVGRNVILNVDQTARSEERMKDSARASSQTLSQYNWESKTNYKGRILAAREKLVAYRLFNENSGEAVRVMERESRVRHLIKDFRHAPVDLQWAVHAPFLAVLDANSNLYIYTVDENGQKLSKYLIIIQEEDCTMNGPGRIVWCPYIPEEDGEEVHLVGVIQGSQVNLFMLNKVKEAIGRTEVSYERVKELDGGMTTIETDSEITACRLSPDATALAAATNDGQLIFFVIEDWDKVQQANSLRPLPNNCIEELVFLDNLSTHSQEEQFWKYVALSSDNGRRLALFDCDNWQCIAKLRFESPNQVNRMELLVEPSTNFLFVADYDASNLFCIELSQQQQSGGQLCFSACTQVTFCNPLICIVPCSLAEQFDSAGDLSLEDDDGSAGCGQNSTVVASLVAINQRSLLELSIELDRVFTVDPSVATSSFSQPQIRSISQQQHIPPPPPPPNPLDMQQQRLAEDYDPQAEILNLQAENGIKLINNIEMTAPTFNNDSGSNQMAPPFTNFLDTKFGEMTEKIEFLSLQVQKLQEENEQLRTNQNDNLSNVLEKISNELKLREERMEASVKKASKESSEQMLRSTEALLSQYAVNVQRSVELSQTRQAEQVHVSLERAVVPQVEVFCTQLFHQLNDTFRSGLQEFMEQLRTISQQQQAQVVAQQQLTPLEQLNRLLEGNQTTKAFEFALSKSDNSSPLLAMVYKKVDPDVFFAASSDITATVPPPLPVSVMLSLLLQLSKKLDCDTELKLRYIENILSSLNAVFLSNKQALIGARASNGEEFRSVMQQLNKAIKDFSEQDINEIWKRQIRLIFQFMRICSAVEC